MFPLSLFGLVIVILSLVGVCMFIAFEVRITDYMRQANCRRLSFRETILNFAQKERTARLSWMLAAILFLVVFTVWQMIDLHSLPAKILQASLALAFAFLACMIAVVLRISLLRND
jgi:hypothetical protein